MAQKTNPSVETDQRLSEASEDFDATTLLYAHLRQALPGSELTDWKKTFIASTLLLQKVEFEKMHETMTSMNESIVEKMDSMKESAIEEIQESVFDSLNSMERYMIEQVAAMRREEIEKLNSIEKKLDSMYAEIKADNEKQKKIMYVQLVSLVLLVGLLLHWR